MVVKSKRGRRRYIAFQASPPRSLSFQRASDLMHRAQDRTGARGLKVIQVQGDVGIIRCQHLDQEKVILALNALGASDEMGFGLRTLLSSGTLRTLREELDLPRPPRPSR